MKKPAAVLSILLIIAIAASCSKTPEPEPVVVPDFTESMPAPAVPKTVPLVVEDYSGDPTVWQSHEFTLAGYDIILKLPFGVSINPNIGECAIETTRRASPPGFLLNSVYDIIKVGRIYFPANIEKIDDDTYQASMFSSAYGIDEELITYTYSEEIVDGVFTRYDKFIVFMTDGGGLFNAIEYYDEETGIMISFWRSHNEEVFTKQGRPMFEDIVSNIEVVEVS